jgi:hypothetical protein
MAGALLALFLSVFALTLSEALHRAFHADACQPQHQCAVTMLKTGQVETPVCPSVVISVSDPVIVAVVTEIDFIPSVDFSLPPSCGPPALLS